MKFSDAIRAGAAVTHPIYAELVGDAGGTCALGAALVAINAISTTESISTGEAESYHRVLKAKWPVLCSGVPIGNVKFPISIVYDLLDCVWYANDSLKWTREAVADWLDSLGYDLEEGAPVVALLKPHTIAELAGHFTKVATPIEWPEEEGEIEAEDSDLGPIAEPDHD